MISALILLLCLLSLAYKFKNDSKGLILGIWSANAFFGNILGSVLSSYVLHYGWGELKIVRRSQLYSLFTHNDYFNQRLLLYCKWDTCHRNGACRRIAIGRTSK